MITLTFLGVGAALPIPGKTNSSFLLESGSTRILFDCGPSVLQQLAAVERSPGDISHVFVSHGHGDHALGWPMFLLWWSIEGRESGRQPPTVLASAATWEHLHGLWKHSYSELPAPPFVAVELPNEGGSTELTPKIRLITRPMVHSERFPVLGARFEVDNRVIAFTADSACCDNIVELAREAHLLVHDARYAVTVPPERHEESRYHCSARDAGRHAQRAKVEQLALVHIGAEYRDAHAALVAEARTVFHGQVYAPREGERILFE